MEAVGFTLGVARRPTVRVLAFLACFCVVACSAGDQEQQTEAVGPGQGERAPPHKYSLVEQIYVSQHTAAERGIDVATASFHTVLVVDVKPVEPRAVERAPIKVISQSDTSRILALALFLRLQAKIRSRSPYTSYRWNLPMV